MSKIVVVMPAYNAAKTLAKTFHDLPHELRGNVILVDDASSDKTSEVSKSLGIKTIVHEKNLGYGGNQKTCYEAALKAGADIVVMVHPDYQYDARLASLMARFIELGVCDLVLGNRIRTRKEALQGGMPLWKYLINRISTLFENFVLGQSLGDFHSGFRAYSRELLETIPFQQNSNDFGFDQQLLVQAVSFGFKLGDVPVPVRYMEDASSINLRRSLIYGADGLKAILSYLLHRSNLRRDPKFISGLKA